MKNILLILPILFFMSSCKSLNTQISINASAEKVWQIIADTQNYSGWNSFLKIEGEIKNGNTLKIEVSPPGKDTMSFEPRVLQFEPYNLLWRGRLFMPGLFTGEHHFFVEKVSDNQVIFHQDEKFSGILVPFVGLKETKLGFEKMNKELKTLAEANQ